jgi:hypothetical protein
MDLNKMYPEEIEHYLSGRPSMLSTAEFGRLPQGFRCFFVADEETSGSFSFSERFPGSPRVNVKQSLCVVSEARPIKEWAMGHEIGHLVYKDSGLPYVSGQRSLAREIFCDFHGILRYCRKSQKPLTVDLVRKMGRINVGYSNWRDEGCIGTFVPSNYANATSVKALSIGALEYVKRFQCIIANLDTMTSGWAGLVKVISDVKE